MLVHAPLSLLTVSNNKLFIMKSPVHFKINKSQIALRNYKVLRGRTSEIQKVVSDWDDTITDGDTIHLIFDCLSESAPHKLDYFFKIYMNEYRRYHSQVLPHKSYKERNNIEKEIQYQKDMKPIELSSFNACINLQTFKGIRKEALRSQCDKVQTRDGFIEFVMHLMKQKDHPSFEILTVNWTSVIIKEYLKRTLGEITIPIYSNELKFDEENVCVGIPDHSKEDLRTGYDKLNNLKRIGFEKKVAYIGDSETDVLPMIYSDLAIVMKGGSAAKQLRNMNFTIKDINHDIISPSENVKFIQVDDWFDILALWNQDLVRL